MKLKPFTPIESELRTAVEAVCDYCLANFISFSAANIADTLREVYGVGVNIEHEAVRPLVCQVMTRKPNVEKQYRGSFIFYSPVKTKLSFDTNNFNSFKIPSNVPNTFSQIVEAELKEFERVESGWISGFRYDYQNLYISFKTGGITKFFDVPLYFVNDFRNSQSKGRFFNQNIKGKFYSVLV